VIPGAAITAWGTSRPWPNRAAIEQDLLLARTIVEIYRDPMLRDELVFRGGTCLHQLHLPSPLRYSEDLDFVRSSHGPIGPVLDALRAVAQRLGLEVKNVVIGQHPKIAFRALSEDGLPLRLKIEFNTHETAPARPTIRIPFQVDSSWFAGGADVLTFQAPELVSTKLRALYQRKKGRDLFDLWLALNELRLRPADILECFPPYRPDGYTAAAAIANLQSKTADPAFVEDLNQLVTAWPPAYSVQGAADQVISELLTPLDS
jgi:predicted nucleotidyltransferase component of viral defense system